MPESNRNLKIVVYSLLGALIYFPLFLHLERLSLRLWDESRLAMNAFEMSQSGNFIVTTFGGNPDMWNTKPPLMIWLQALCMKVFGYNELAVRLPSAMAGLGIVILIVTVFDRYLKRLDIAFSTALVLVTSLGFICVHVSRSGDYDALLCFSILAVISFTFYWTQSWNDKHLVPLGAAIVVMGLTKGIQGFMILPGIFLYLLITKKLLEVLSSKYFWLTAFISLSVILGYYFIREYYNPDFLAAVWKEELGGRFTRKGTFHVHPYYFHMKNLAERLFFPWIFFLPIGIFFGWISKNQSLKRITQLLTCIALTYLCLISSSRTKLEWYAAPFVVLASIIVGIGIGEIWRKVSAKYFTGNPWKKWIFTTIFFLLIFAWPYKNMFESVYNPLESEAINWRSHKFGQCMKEFEAKNYNVVNIGYNAQAAFYIETLNVDGYNITPSAPDSLSVGSQVLICQDQAKAKIQEHYNIESVQPCELCELIAIQSRK